MSLLRVCSFAFPLSRRGFAAGPTLRVSTAELRRLGVWARSGAGKHTSENILHFQRRNISTVSPKSEDTKKRVLEQSQLLDVLEARIQQLQSDVLDVQRASVQIVKVPFQGRSLKSGQTRTEIFKSGVTASKDSKKIEPRRWQEKLILEKKNKEKKLQLQQETSTLGNQSKKSKSSKIRLFTADKNFKITKSKVIKDTSSPQLPQKRQTAVSSAAVAETTTRVTYPITKSKHQKKKDNTKSSNVSLAPTADMKRHLIIKSKDTKKTGDITILNENQGAFFPIAAEETLPKKNYKFKANQPVQEGKEDTGVVSQTYDTDLFKEGEFEKNAPEQESYMFSDSKTAPEEETEGKGGGNTHLEICSYLEVCVFLGEIERANDFLLRHHRNRVHRKHFTTEVYNVMMKVFAKTGTLNEVGRIFILLKEAGLKPNVDSYAAALECMGRDPKCSPKVITRCLEQMKLDGFAIDDLFSQYMFRHDEWNMILKAIRAVMPDYEPATNLHADKNISPLVKDFYTKREDHTYPKLDFTQEELRDRFSRQLSMEQACTVTINSVEALKPITEHMRKMRKLLDGLRAQWNWMLLKALRENRKTLASAKSRNIYPHLCLLEDSEYVDIMIQSLATLPPSGEPLKYLIKNLGNSVYNRCAVRLKLQNQAVEKLKDIYSTYTELLAKNTEDFKVLPREHWCKLEMEQNSGPSLLRNDITWPHTLTLEIGTFLVETMLKNLKVSSNILSPGLDRKLIPVLYHMYTFRSTRQIGFIKLHPIVAQIQQEAMEMNLTFNPDVVPMMCPPVPWTSPRFGAYLLTPTKLMRTLDGSTQHESLLDKSPNIYPVLDALNQLSNCAWRINKPVLDIIISIFNDRGSEKLDIPPPMSEAPKISEFNTHDPNLTDSEKALLKKQMSADRKKINEMHSLRMDALYKLSIAHHMRDEIFWFPHNMDFRGRTYPCPPYFNHLGSDVSRSMLLFAEGKPLGPKGLDWLKIHLVNLTGLKKRSSIQGRLEFANTLMEDILDSADNPLNGRKWWMGVDEPWQALACCKEIASAVRSPDPSEFISHFPVHQDGSCNGLQHYAALGKDVIGATSVNLTPCDLPQDVYSGVAQMVEEFRATDAGRGVKIAQVLDGFINRKTVKQTVMTVVYGVTRYGARLQIEKRLKETENFPKEYVWDASAYLVNLVFSGMKEMFTGTREIQDWLTESARLISKSGHTVEWVTPLGLPIIQPYHRKNNRTLKSSLQNILVELYNNEKPNTVKQANAFPPNFIHSLDSTHMMLTALNCHSAGLTFVSVHDCFWTHPHTVDVMNRICRKQFVALHSQPILEELSHYLVHKYKTDARAKISRKKIREQLKLMTHLAKVPQTGDFDLQQVKESTYFFS